MRTTGNSIISKVFVGVCRKSVPVMRNGKPTKRTKEVWEENWEERTLTGIEVEGHEVFIDENEKSSREDCFVMYNNNGEKITAEVRIGRTGTKNHSVVAFYNKKTNQVIHFHNGYDGATGRGWGTYLVKVNW